MLLKSLVEIFNLLEQVKTSEYEYPYQVNEVPVQTSFFDHQVVASSVEHTFPGHDEHNDVYHYTRQYVESVETSDGEEEVGKVGRSLCTVYVRERILTPPGTFMVQVCPLPGLAA